MSELGDHRREVSFCAYCPKLCRFSCPVSEADKKETHTPWGKMTAAFHHLQDTRPLDASTGEAIYACTGCLRCKSHCRHGNEVGPALFDARAEAVKTGVAPEAVARLRARFALGSPFGVDLAARAAALSRQAEGREYFPGCTAIVKSPETVNAALSASSGLGVNLAVGPAAGKCCGYPLWAAGLHDEFEAHAKALARSTEDLEELVVGDPGCAYTMVKGYAEAGVTLAPKVVLLVDLLAERLDQAVGRAPLPLEVSYHDACHLGRGLGVYETPRRLLRAAAGEFTEAAERRADAGCSGGGGILPRTMPETAIEIARKQADELGSAKGSGRTVVTACPAARRMFEKSGAEALDLYTVLARWIGAPSPKDP